MSDTTKRYIISAIETFGAAFFGTFLTLLQPAIASGNISKTLVLSILSASFIAGTKVLAKAIRETLFPVSE